jgi:GntR family transcriptional regulator / MocR family aminotransferase
MGCMEETGMVKRTGGALLLSVRIDRQSGRPVSTQLLTTLREIILSGGLGAGERMPASRTLARDVGVSRTTVIEVYDRLCAEGLTEARVGAGTYVSDALNDSRPRPDRAQSRAASAAAGRAPRVARQLQRATGMFLERLPHEPRAFTTALPAFDAFPLAQWSRQVAKHWRAHRDVVMGYGDPHGFYPLRRAIAAHLRANRGIGCEAEQVFVVGGAQQAFQILGDVLLDPGDDVWFENPGAIGARNALVASGANLVPVPIDDEGLSVAEGIRLAPRFKLAFVTPAHQQPLGVTMSLKRRFALLQAADVANAYVIEDDYDGEFCYGGHPQPTLKSVDETGRVIYVGTFSKSLFPALRLGYFVCPPSLVTVMETVTSAFLQGVPSNPQAVVADFMEEGRFATHLRRMRRIYAERHQVFLDASRQWLAGRLDVVPTDTGLHTIARLAPDLSEEAVTRAALSHSVTVAPIGRFCISPVATKGLVLGFSGVRPPEIVRGVKTLARALDSLAVRSGGMVAEIVQTGPAAPTALQLGSAGKS